MPQEPVIALFLEPTVAGARELVRVLERAPIAEVTLVPSAAEALQAALQLSPCVLVISLTTDHAGPELDLVKRLEKPIRLGQVKCLVISAIKNHPRATELAEMAPVDYAEEPVPVRSLMFKMNLALKAVLASRKRTEQQEDVVVFKSAEPVAEEWMKFDAMKGEVAARFKPALQLGEDIFVFRNVPPRKVAGVFLLQAEGPHPDTGEWQEEPAKPGATPAWRWVPHPQDGEPPPPAGDGWLHAGERPSFNPGSRKWQLRSVAPELAYRRNGEKVATKVERDPRGQILIAQDSNTARDNLALNQTLAVQAREARQKQKRAAPAATPQDLSVREQTPPEPAPVASLPWENFAKEQRAHLQRKEKAALEQNSPNLIQAGSSVHESAPWSQADSPKAVEEIQGALEIHDPMAPALLPSRAESLEPDENVNAGRLLKRKPPQAGQGARVLSTGESAEVEPSAKESPVNPAEADEPKPVEFLESAEDLKKEVGKPSGPLRSPRRAAQEKNQGSDRENSRETKTLPSAHEEKEEEARERVQRAKLKRKLVTERMNELQEVLAREITRPAREEFTAEEERELRERLAVAPGEPVSPRVLGKREKVEKLHSLRAKLARLKKELAEDQETESGTAEDGPGRQQHEGAPAALRNFRAIESIDAESREDFFTQGSRGNRLTKKDRAGSISAGVEEEGEIFFLARSETVPEEGRWEREGNQFLYLPNRVFRDGVSHLEELFPLWLFEGKHDPELEEPAQRWKLRGAPARRLEKESDLPARWRNSLEALNAAAGIKKAEEAGSESIADSAEADLQTDPKGAVLKEGGGLKAESEPAKNRGSASALRDPSQLEADSGPEQDATSLALKEHADLWADSQLDSPLEQEDKATAAAILAPQDSGVEVGSCSFSLDMLLALASLADLLRAPSGTVQEAELLIFAATPEWAKAREGEYGAQAVRVGSVKLWLAPKSGERNLSPEEMFLFSELARVLEQFRSRGMAEKIAG